MYCLTLKLPYQKHFPNYSSCCSSSSFCKYNISKSYLLFQQTTSTSGRNVLYTCSKHKTVNYLLLRSVLRIMMNIAIQNLTNVSTYDSNDVHLKVNFNCHDFNVLSITFTFFFILCLILRMYL